MTPLLIVSELIDVIFKGNPLSDIPRAFMVGGWTHEFRTYLRSILSQSENFAERRVVLVGQEGVGKSEYAITMELGRKLISCLLSLSSYIVTLPAE